MIVMLIQKMDLDIQSGLALCRKDLKLLALY